jgi:hypothetical protein
MPANKDGVIIVPTDEVIIVPDKAVMVVRTDAEVAAAIMAAGPEFGKIHKSAKGDFFFKTKLSRR